jgi:putative Mn2+ efflux pump MntP
VSGLSVLGIAIGLAMDAFSVAVAVGLVLDRVGSRHVFRIAFHFGLFQFLMPVVGYLAGATLEIYIRAFDPWVSFGLLMIIGGKMLVDALLANGRQPDSDPTRGLKLVSLSLATSIDALAVGMSLAFMAVPILLPAAVIGLVAGVLSALGICFGGRIQPRWRKATEMAGGLIIIAVGVRVLIVF